jgi:hypothetical protein
LKKSKKGQKAHRIFEALKYQLDLSHVFSEDPSLKAAADFILKLQSPPFQEFFAEGSVGTEWNVEVEWGFTVEWSGKKLTGPDRPLGPPSE